MRYLHTMLRVRNLDNALDFYCNKLGLREVRRRVDEKNRYTLVFLAGPEDEHLVEESKRAKGRLLSLSTWRDEKAVIRWRTHGEHHGVQEKGRFEIFEDYHVRVGEVTDDSDPPRGLAIVQQRFDETAKLVAKAVSITEFDQPEGDKPKIAAGGTPCWALFS